MVPGDRHREGTLQISRAGSTSRTITAPFRRHRAAHVASATTSAGRRWPSCSPSGQRARGDRRPARGAAPRGGGPSGRRTPTAARCRGDIETPEALEHSYPAGSSRGPTSTRPRAVPRDPRVEEGDPPPLLPGMLCACDRHRAPPRRARRAQARLRARASRCSSPRATAPRSRSRRATPTTTTSRSSPWRRAPGSAPHRRRGQPRPRTGHRGHLTRCADRSAGTTRPRARR